MKTIYKSIALEAALLSVTLALQAEIQSEGQTVTADVQASTLDRLKVTLVSPNVSGARDLVASGNATIDGNEIAVNLDNLTFGTHRLVVSARFGTQIRTLYALDISVPQAELPNETQEYEDAAIVVSTYGDGGGGGEFPTDYAKQGDDPTATLTDTQAYAKAAAEAAQSLIAVDADIFAGKQALATNISAKGVPTAVADALITMATKVLQIPQQINTRTSEFEQMIAPSPYMWNVYSVASDLMKNELPAYIPAYMSSGNYVQYRANNAFFVGEYYRGYDSLELTGADGYLTHDGCFYTLINGTVTRTAPDGTVTTYEDTTIIHTWLNNPEDTYFNRWVAFFYLTNAYSFTNTTPSICPRRVAICGMCEFFIISGANRLTDVWVIGTLGTLCGGNTGDTWNPQQAVCNYAVHTNTNPVYDRATLLSVIFPDLNTITGKIFGVNDNVRISYIYMPKLETIANFAFYIPTGDVECNLAELYLPELKYASVPIIASLGNYAVRCDGLRDISLPSIEELNVTGFGGGYSINSDYALFISGYHGGFNGVKKISLPNLKRVVSGFVFAYNQGGGYTSFKNLIDLGVGELTTSFNCKYWKPDDVLADATKTAQLIDNIKNHILARVSDATGGTQLVFTVSTNMYNAIASETITWQDQTMTLADAFLTKNWLLAGA